MPDSTPSSMPPVRPNEWKTGSALNTMSAGVMSKRALICATFDTMFRCDSTTPFGAPSDPAVNSTTAGSSALRLVTSDLLADRKALILSPVPISLRKSSSQQIFTDLPSSATIVPRFAF